MSQSVGAQGVRLIELAGGARVHHFDQLDDQQQERFLSAVADEARLRDVPGLRRGDVVVFTDYYTV